MPQLLTAEVSRCAAVRICDYQSQRWKDLWLQREFLKNVDTSQPSVESLNHVVFKDRKGQNSQTYCVPAPIFSLSSTLSCLFLSPAHLYPVGKYSHCIQKHILII